MKTKQIIHINSSTLKLSLGTCQAPWQGWKETSIKSALRELVAWHGHLLRSYISVDSGKGMPGLRGSFLKEVAFGLELKGGDTPSSGGRWQLGKEIKIHTQQRGQREQVQGGPRATAVGCTKPVGQFTFCKHLGEN